MIGDGQDALRLRALGNLPDLQLVLRCLRQVLAEDAKRDADKKTAASASGSEFAVIAEDGEPDAEVESKILARRDAKKAKNFAEADRIRDELKDMGIEVTDIPNGAKWKRI